VEVPSSVSGTVKEILVKEGDKIKVGQIVFTADNKGTSAAAARELRGKKIPNRKLHPRRNGSSPHPPMRLPHNP